MNIVVAPDSFKGSMTAIQAAHSMRMGIEDVMPNSNVITKPMADGGEGTLNVLLDSARGKIISVTCTGVLGERKKVNYGILDDETAVIECAKIIGLDQVAKSNRNPNNTTTYGIGEVIKDALDRKCKSIIIGIGGTATNDGGFGMFQAMGMIVKNQYGKVLGHFGRNFLDLYSIDFDNFDSRILNVPIQIASDVTNILCGHNGATAVYGPQKGATINQVEKYDCIMKKYSNLLKMHFGNSFEKVPGSGAGGGLGLAFLTLGGKLISGANLVAKQINLSKEIKQADLVITGEGHSDEQTLYGKAPGYVAELALKHNVPVLLISGGVSYTSVLADRFTGCFSITPHPMTLNECLKNGELLLSNQVKLIMHFYNKLSVSCVNYRSLQKW